MTLKTQPAYIGQTGYLHPVELDRNMTEGLAQNRSGPMRYGGFQASTGVGTRAVAVSPGQCILVGVENAQQGAYMAWSDSADTFLLAAGVTNPRIDTIVLRVIDDQYGTISGSPRAEFEVVQGVAAASPTARVDADFNVGGSFYKPGAWFRIADCRVNVGDTTIPTGQITINHTYPRVGGTSLCLSTNRPSDPVIGDRIYEINTGFWRRWDGTAWMQNAPWRAYQVLGANAAAVTFTSIPTSLKHINIKAVARSSTAAVAANMRMSINNDTALNYFYNLKQLNNVTRSVPLSGNVNYWPIAVVAGASGAAGNMGGCNVDIVNWDGTYLHMTSQNHFWDSAASSWLQETGGLYFAGGPATYTRMDFFMDAGNVAAGSKFLLTGWE